MSYLKLLISTFVILTFTSIQAIYGMDHPGLLAPDTAFSVGEYAKGVKPYNDLDEAIAAIDNDEKILIVSFPLNQILGKTKLEYFKAFLARLADYIFVIRIIESRDLFDTLRVSNFGMALPNNNKNPANMFFIHGEVASVTIRGLGANKKEIKIVADNLLRGIGEPEKIAMIKLIKPISPSENLANLLNWPDFTPESLECLNRYLNARTGGNLRAILPCNDFYDALGLEENHLLATCNNFFFGVIRDKLMPGIKELNPKCFDSKTYDRLKDPTAEVYEAMREWAQKSDIKKLLLSSLFVK